MSEEQSHRPMTDGPKGSLQVPPHWYQEPICATAHDIAVSMIALPVSSTWPGSGRGDGSLAAADEPGVTDHCEARSVIVRTYAWVSWNGGTPWYCSTAPGPALYAASMSSVRSPGTAATCRRSCASYRAAAGIASWMSNGSALPSPFSSRPYAVQVAGMNWAMPSAPTGETAGR